MFDPLLRRAAIYENISGAEVEEFLRRRFDEEISKLGITAEFTTPFRQFKWPSVKRPNFLGALHNLFLNAVYWCRQGQRARHIRLSITVNHLILSDSGPGVIVRDTERIFEPGFSRRPSGRGLGLYIARESLRGMGYDLLYSETPELGALNGANFIILKNGDNRND
jgi:signal transduction histidine kinase